MKKYLQTTVYVIFFAHFLHAQVTSSTFDPAWAARFQDAINSALPSSAFHGVSVALTFPGMGTFIGVAGESAPGIPMTPDMQFGIGTNSKLFTTVLALKLQELGILSLDDKLSDWLPAYANIDGSATIRQCLLHETGFFDYTSDIDPTDAVLVNEPQHVYTQQEALQRIGSPHFAVGRAMLYSNTNYNLVGLAIEAASKKTYTELLHQYILDPLDLDSTFFAVYETPNGNVAHGWFFNQDIGTTPLSSPLSIYWSAGAIYSTANEMVQWYDNLFAGNIINQASLQQMRFFDQSTFYGLGVQYLYHPLTPEDEVDGELGNIPGYTSSMGYDIKRHSSLCILGNEGEGNSDIMFAMIGPLVTQLEFGYPRRTNDAGITKIVSPSSERCGGSFSPEVLLQNFGSSNLQSVVINYQVDNGAVNSYNWTGNLLTDATTPVTLPFISPSAGYHSFRVFTSNPNGSAEGHNYNDEASSKFTINNGPLATSIDEGFEGSAFPTGWQNGNNTVFDWGQTNVGYFANGSNKGVARNNWDDGTGRSYDLELPYLDLSADNNPVLSFNYAYGFYKAHPQRDELTVLVSKDCGKTYHSVFNKSGDALKTSNATTFHYPVADEWGTRTINLSAYKTNVLIKFRMTDGNGDLFYLDNIKVANVSAICQTPTDLNELQVTSSSVKLNWKFQGSANQFDVYYRPKGSGSWNHKSVAGNKQWTDISGLSPETDYEWYITTACNAANSLASPYSFFTTQSALTQQAEPLPETNDVLANNLKVTPNPVSSSALISFSLAQPGKVSLKVYDLNGKLISTMAEGNINEGVHQLRWETKNVASGVYFLKMQAAGTVQTKKLIVVK